ncbi:hypothetical protein Tco_0587725 [Tanacetum coccineum]
MALLLDEERFLKIKQAMEEEHNQPEVLQELLLKLISDLQILKGIQQEKKKPTTQSSIPYWNFSMIDDEEARDNFMKDVCTFLRTFSRIPFGVTPMVILIAWESFGEIKDALMNNWNRPLFYFDDDDDEYAVIWRRPKVITPDEPIKEPDNSLSIGDEHLSTIPETESDEVIKSRCENHLSPNPKILSDSNNDGTSSDDDDFEDVEYVSLKEVNDEKEFDLEDIFQIQDVILHEKLLSIHRLISNIESLKDNPTPDRVFESPSPFPIPVADSDSFLEESDTSLSHLDNSLPEFESSSDHTESDEKWQYHSHANNYSFPSRMIRLFLDSSSLRESLMMTKGEVRLIFLKMMIPSHLLSGLFSHFSPTPRFLLYLAPPGVKIRSLIPASPLRAGGLSSGWNFHDYLDFEDSRAHGFVHLFELHILSFI